MSARIIVCGCRNFSDKEMELERRTEYCQEVGLKRYGFVSLNSSFVSKIVCGHCEAVYTRKSWSTRGQHTWVCRNKEQRNGGTCQAENVKDEVIRQAVVIAWNSVVKERDKLIRAWEAVQKSGDPLQALRAKQMIEITAQGSIKWEIPELTRTVLERIVIHNKRHFTVQFLDGTAKEVLVDE